MKQTTEPAIVTETVQDLFHTLETAEPIPYAVLRNYEDFPRFHHDVDLVMATEHLPLLRSHLKRLAQDQDWGVLVEYPHWSGTSFPHQNIEVFRFYDPARSSFLQLDVFHGYLLWSVPLFEEQTMLEGRIRDSRGFTRIDPFKEHLFTLLQINAVFRTPGTQDRVTLYRQRVLEFYKQEGIAFVDFVAHYLGAGTTPILDALHREDYPLFSARVNRAKGGYLFSRFVNRPLDTLQNVWTRLMYCYRTYYGNPSGIVLPVDTSDESNRQMLLQALDQLVEQSMLRCYTAQWGHRKPLCFRERQILERGGIVVKWSCRKEKFLPDSVEGLNNLRITPDLTPDILSVGIQERLIRHGTLLYERTHEHPL